MAPTPPTVPPGRIVAGDSASWTRAFQDYPASDGWTLAYTIVGPTSVYTVAAEAVGDGFAVNLAPTDTAAWTSGTYTLVEATSNTGERITLNTSTLVVAANLAGATAGADAGVDTTTHAARMLALINAWLEKRAPMAADMEINGRKIQYYAIADLLKLRDRYAIMVAREQAAPGQTAGTRILVRL